MHNSNTQHVSKPMSAVCVNAVLTGTVYRQDMNPVVFVFGHMAKDPPKGY
jgi:hypothetical protein